MAELGAPSFDTLRPWNGEQSRAFEELSFQLLKHRVPPGTRAIRTGNPDGGVEWYVTLPDETEWGWQVKYVKRIDTLLTAMTDSAKRVAKERPNLRRLTFVISWNVSTGKAGKDGRERKSQRQKYEDKIKTWQGTIPGAERIIFELLQESDLLDELAKAEHRGRRWFWWDSVVFGRSWLEQRHITQALAAGQKYRPDLQVDVPIQEDLLALGFDQSTLAIFDRLRRSVISAAADVRLSSKDEDESDVALYQGILDAVATLKSTANAISLRAADPPEVLESLARQLSVTAQAIDAAQDYERGLAAAWRELPDNDLRKAKKPPERANSYAIRELEAEITELVSWFESSVGRSFQCRAYFLTGQAGSGKTHLFLDATRRALDGGRPAIFLAGAQFGHSNLWGSIADQLGLQAVGADVLLSAMDAAGEAASTFGSRFVIFVDALNETMPAVFWRIHLPMLRAAIAPYPHVALAVSCRDTYTDLVEEGAENAQYVRRSHPGFAEREVEATQRYFSHYGLEAPKIPLLTPEFTLPLFLRLYCESLALTDPGSMPTGHQGRVAIFERYLAAKTVKIAQRVRPDAGSDYELGMAKTWVGRVIDALLDELSRLGSESMSAGTAEAVSRASLADSGSDATRVLGLLQDEGVLTRERLYLGNGSFDEGVRIVFQAFADFLLLRRRLALSTDPLNDQAVKSWLTDDCSWGINEAATILFPEMYGVELPDLLGISLPAGRSQNEAEDRAAWERHHRAQQLYRSLVETLPYRDSRAISQRTIDLLNHTQRFLPREKFYQVLFMLAPQSGNVLNGDGLHKYLNRLPMPRRDSDFGFATYHELSDSSSPAARLARWAAAGPYPAYDAEVIELACIPLCWLLSSPNRFMRDWITKALAQLLRGHLDVMRTLLERFWTVDDPYVVQRVVAIAYGSLLRSTPSQSGQARVVAERVYALVFSRPIRPDELLLDSARGVVRWAVGQGLLPSSAVVSSWRPYGLKPPGPPPSESRIEAKYGWRKDQPDDESYSSINFSLLGMGDFARYVVESGVHHFSRYRIGQTYPEREHREPRLIKARWRMFVKSLSGEQQRALADWLQDGEGMRRLYFPISREEDPLSEVQRTLFKASWANPKPIDDRYPAKAACRWIFRRTIGLGWTPKLFGRKDRILGQGRGREGHKSERWGKKYQWMAYHELLARVADNYQASRSYGDSQPYAGLHEITGEREIDPSLPPIQYTAFNEHSGSNTAAWDPPMIRLGEWPPASLDFSRYRGDLKRFLADTESEPTIARSTLVRDSDGDMWVVVDSYARQIDPMADKSWRGLQQFTSVDTLLISADRADAFLTALPDDPRHEVRDLVDAHGHIDCCYVGEVGRIGPDCPHREDLLRLTTLGDTSFPVVPSTERYTWEGSILDCSIGESATTVLPSTFIQQTIGLTFDMRGPSWLDATGLPLFTYYEERGKRSHALLVRASFLKDFLVTHKLELVVLHWFERMRLSADHHSEEPYVESRSEGLLGADLAIRQGKLRRTGRGLE